MPTTPSATGKIEIVAELDGNGARTEGYQSTADALQSHDDLASCFCHQRSLCAGCLHRHRGGQSAGSNQDHRLRRPARRQAGHQGRQDFCRPHSASGQMGQQIVQNIVKYQAGEAKRRPSSQLRFTTKPLPMRIPS